MNTLLALLVAGPWGVAVGLHPRAAAELGIDVVPDIEEVASLGGNAILLPVAWSQRDVTATWIAPDADTIDDPDLRRAMARARRAGLAVALMPYITVRDGEAQDWRGVLRPADEESWWRSYDAMILHYARIAEEGAAALVIGSELSSMQNRAERWEALACRVRRVYAGQLAYVSNHDALDVLEPFAFVDLAGVSAYFPLTTELEATHEQLAAGWARVNRRLAAFGRKSNRPLVLFEIGYASIDGAATKPWDDTIGAPIDLEEQRRLYRAARVALTSAPHVAGAFFWGWFGPGGRHDRTFTPRGKPALGELKGLLRAKTVSSGDATALFSEKILKFESPASKASTGDVQSGRRQPREHGTLGAVGRGCW